MASTSPPVTVDPADTVRPAVDRFMETTNTPGVAVSVYANDRDYHFAFGYTALEDQDPQPITEETIFCIGSITKTFTATLLAAQAAEGIVSLGDAVTEHLPPLGPTHSLIHKVTLQQLATHTAGLPKPSNQEFGDELFEDQPPGELIKDYWRSHPPISGDPPLGTIWEYSNVGFITLGFALAGTIGYNKVLLDTVTGPLGLEATSTTPPPNYVISRGYDKQNTKPQPHLASDLKSTSKDMLNWLKAQFLRPHESIWLPVDSGMRIAQLVFFGSPAMQFQMGLAWQQSNGIFAKDGATGMAGFTSWIGFAPEQGVALAMLANRDYGVGNQTTSDVGREMLVKIAGISPTPNP